MMMFEIKKREFFRGETIEDLVRGTVGGCRFGELVSSPIQLDWG
jgi:hypothetical protein